MSDLVEALRRHRHHGPLFTQAADEIERLRTSDPLLQEARELLREWLTDFESTLANSDLEIRTDALLKKLEGA